MGTIKYVIVCPEGIRNSQLKVMREGVQMNNVESISINYHTVDITTVDAALNPLASSSLFQQDCLDVKTIIKVDIKDVSFAVWQLVGA